MAKSRRYTNEQLIEAVKESSSYRQVLGKIGLSKEGGNYASIKRIVTRLGCDTTHFTGQLWSKGRSVGPRRPIEDYLSENPKAIIASHHLKQRLIREGIKDSKCEICKLDQWLDKPIPLELDHINGIHSDNRIENLRILCPNCHAGTATYRGKNQVRHREKEVLRLTGLEPVIPEGKRLLRTPRMPISPQPHTFCLACSNPIYRKDGKYCSQLCNHSALRKVARPSKEELQDLLSTTPVVKIAKQFGVSDSAVRKWSKSYNIDTLSISPFAKKHNPFK